MIRSMTGFGRAREVLNGRDIAVDMKAVNHRFFEAYVRMPRAYAALEDNIRSTVQGRVARGKIEITVTVNDNGADVPTISVNKPLFEQYYAALKDVSTTYGLKMEDSASLALRFPEVISSSDEETDMDALWQDIKVVLDKAVDAFIEQREKEGGRLANDIVAKCAEIKGHVDYIDGRSAQLVDEYIVKLKARIADLLGDTKVDETRLLTEVAIMADRLAIDEEIVRLNSHTATLAEMFEKGISNGKKMDFIIQEMNREINTISSKIGDLDVTKRVIEVKTCIEKIREQVQNIE